MSGLTVGYLSIDELVLELRTIGGSDEEKEIGKTIQEVLSSKHRLLVTLLLSNAAAMEALPIFINKLVPEWAAIIISTTLVLFVGEVLPQAVCTGPDQLKIAARLAPFTKWLIWILYPLNEPLGYMLDKLLGIHNRNRLMNTDLRVLIELHTYSALKKFNLLHAENEKKEGGNAIINSETPSKEVSTGNLQKQNNNYKKNIEMQDIDSNDENIGSLNDQSYTGKPLDMPKKRKLDSEIGGSHNNLVSSSVKSIGQELLNSDFGLNEEQANLMVSAIEMKDKKAIEVMIPINKTFMVSYDSPVDNVNLSVILEKGYSRIPVYANNNNIDIIGLVRIKQLIGVNLSERKSMRQHGIILKKPLVISPRMNLLELLREFKKGKSHMAFITEQVKDLQKKLNYISTGRSDKERKENSNIQVIGIVTLEDVIEKMINIEILDEDDYDHINKGNQGASYIKSKLLNFFIDKILFIILIDKILTNNVSKEIIKENTLKLNSILNESFKKKSFFNHYVNNNDDSPLSSTLKQKFIN